jgi:integrase
LFDPSIVIVSLATRIALASTAMIAVAADALGTTDTPLYVPPDAQTSALIMAPQYVSMLAGVSNSQTLTLTVRLEVGTTKNKDGREFMYRDVPDVAAAIDRQWGVHETLRKARRIVPLVFHRNGRPIRSFFKAWKAASRAAGCPGRLLHDCRRTTVRNLERAGVSRSVAMRLTGHKTEAVYRRYAIVSSEDMADAARKLQA